MARREGEEYDRTFLSEKVHGKRLHRDYAAHYFRWGFVGKRFTKNKRVLEIGCGKETPLVYVLSGQRGHVPELYVGVDLNPIPKPPHRFWAEWYPETDFMRSYRKINKNGKRKFDTIVCLEVIEHMEIEAGDKLLKAARLCLDEGGVFLLSTPVFNGKAAKNHVHEYTIYELWKHIENAGLAVVRRFGTFMNWHEIKKCASPGERQLLEELKEWYSTEVLSTFLAPKYPDNSRNNLWVLCKPSDLDSMTDLRAKIQEEMFF